MLFVISHSSETLKSVIDRFEGLLHSFFVQPLVLATFGYGRTHETVLIEFLEELQSGRHFAELGRIDLETSKQFSLLGRFEFEGALIQLLMQGTATRDVVANLAEARAIANALLCEITGTEHTPLLAYRMDNDTWSELSTGNTFEASFCVYFSTLRLWWILVLADDY